MTVRLDSEGLAELLKSAEVADAVHDLAEKVAASVRGAEPDATDVVVDDYTTDRRASSVTVRDVRGKLWQVRDGLLTRAAAGQGLEVTEK